MIATASHSLSLTPFGQAQILQIQRARILAGAVQAMVEQGAGNVAISDIVLRAGVSRRTFYELFADRDECFAAVFDDAFDHAAASVLPAVRAKRSWVERLRAAVSALMRFLDEQPQLGRVLLCESLTEGSAMAQRRSLAVARLTAFVEQGRTESRDGEHVPAVQAEGSVGGALAILQNLIASDQHVRFAELSGPLVAMIAMPYLGRAAARRELERPAPAPDEHSHEQAMPVLSLPFKEAGMRLTYRTTRVLLAIAEQPDASNRQIGELAEIGDQGQTSKLLRRLERAELIANQGIAPGQGGPNAWRLTATGLQVADGIRAHATSAPLRPRRSKHNQGRGK